MTEGKILAVCQSGGEFVTNPDGSLTYTGGEAHAVDINREMTLRDLLLEIRDVFDWSGDCGPISIKYFLPGNRRTLISVSNNKDLRRMVDFNADSITTDVYVLRKNEKRMAAVVEAATPPPAAAAATPLLPAAATAAVAITPSAVEPQRSKLCEAWEKLITGVGQVFEDVRVFRDALHKYAIARGFTYKFIKNDGSRVTAECSLEGCPWRIHASELPSKRQFVVRKLGDKHTCNGETGRHGHRLANQRWMAGVIRERLRESPDYSPREIMIDFDREFGVKLNYAQAWRGRSIAKKELRQSPEEEDPGHLLWLCRRITETNPGSAVVLDAGESSAAIRRLFVCFHASLLGFERGCRPLVFLQGIPLEASVRWRLLAATAVDGNDDSFPLAFAAVEDENGENWTWFLEQLRAALPAPRRCSLTFVSGRQAGLEAAVAEVFEGSHHALSLSHLVENFRSQLERRSWAAELKDEVVGCLERAAYAYTEADFHTSIDAIRSTSDELAQWVLLSTPPELWSNAFFPGSRYDVMAVDAAEAFSSGIAKFAREPTLIQIVDLVRCNIMESIYRRRESVNAWSGAPLTPRMSQKLEAASSQASSLRVISSDGGELVEVGDGGGAYAVNLQSRGCACMRWQTTGLPCAHAVAAIAHGGGCVYDYCSSYFKTDFHRAAYAESINPIPDAGGGGGAAVPPSSRSARLPGGAEEETAELQKASKRSVQCSRCHQIGHNRLTCKASG